MAGKQDFPDEHTTLCSQAAWTDEQVSLHDVSSQFTLPTLAQVVTGRYRGIAPADSKHHHHHHHHHASSRRSSSSIVFIQSVRTSQKVLMEAVKVQPNGRHVVTTGHNYSMPLTYAGWFEVLSEDGKAIEPVSTVAELASVWPAECIVREPLRAIVCSGAKHDSPAEHGASTRLDQTRAVTAGEWLALRDVVDATVETASRDDDGPGDNVPQTKHYLRCVDAVGDSVFLDMNQRALLSPVAGPYNISGVHSVQSLLDKFRLPLIVRLVYGVIPTKLEKTSTHVFRLMGVYEDETAFILPLQTATPTDARMLSVSTREPLVVVGADNIDVLRHSPAFAVVEHRCSELVRAYMTSIHVLVAAPDTDALARGNQLLKDSQNLRLGGSPTTNDDDDNDGVLYDEIDDIYRYVRQGGEPPSPRAPPTATAADTSADAGRQQPAAATQEGDADYNWEEPIYEDIEKIRQRKRQRATTTEATTTTTTGDDEQARGTVDVMPIGSLRQLIKRFSMLESETGPKPKPARRLDRTPPPPPKLTVDMAVSCLPPAGQPERQRQRVDPATRLPPQVEYADQPDPAQRQRMDMAVNSLPPAGQPKRQRQRVDTAARLPTQVEHVDQPDPAHRQRMDTAARLPPQVEYADQPDPAQRQRMDIAVSSLPPAGQPDPAHRQRMDTAARLPPQVEYDDDEVSVNMDDDDDRQNTSRRSAQHVDAPPPPAVSHARVENARADSHSGCVTSIRVSRDVGPRRQQLHDTSPYFCSRVSVGAGSTLRQVVVDAQPSVTRITTLSRSSARRMHDVHQQTA